MVLHYYIILVFGVWIFFFVCFRKKKLQKTTMSSQSYTLSLSVWQKATEKMARKLDRFVKGSRLPLQPRVVRNLSDQENRTILKPLPDLVALLEKVVDAGEEVEATILVINVITTKMTRLEMTMKKRKSLTKTTMARMMTKKSKLLLPKFRLDL